jgi:hypothetical protein
VRERAKTTGMASWNRPISPLMKRPQSPSGPPRQLLGPFEKTRMAMVFTNARTTENLIVFANASFLELSVYGSKVLGESLIATKIEYW